MSCFNVAIAFSGVGAKQKNSEPLNLSANNLEYSNRRIQADLSATP
jgi:hypothetical protein